MKHSWGALSKGSRPFPAECQSPIRSFSGASPFRDARGPVTGKVRTITVCEPGHSARTNAAVTLPHLASAPHMEFPVRRLARLLLIAPTTLALGATASSAHAQPATTAGGASAPANTEPTMRAAVRRLADKHGLWASLGVGRGAASLDCDACATATTRAYSIQGTLGIRLSPRFLVGAETFAWLDVMGGHADRVAKGTYLVARGYRAAKSKLFLQTGVGLASFEVNDGEVKFRTRSPSLSLTGGYDWRIDRMTITPAITAVGSSGGHLKSDKTGNSIADDARLGLLRATISLSWFR